MHNLKRLQKVGGEGRLREGGRWGDGKREEMNSLGNIKQKA